MGAFGHISSSDNDDPNPDPRNFEITCTKHFGDREGNELTILFVTYPNCTNFEGKKILVFSGNIDMRERLASAPVIHRVLDPHFTQHNRLLYRVSPIGYSIFKNLLEKAGYMETIE